MDVNVTTNCKAIENQSWEEAVVERVISVALVALFCVLWVFWTLLQFLELGPEQKVNQ